MSVYKGNSMNGETCVHELMCVTKLYEAARKINPAMSGHQGMSVDQVTSMLQRLVTTSWLVTESSKCEEGPGCICNKCP